MLFADLEANDLYPAVTKAWVLVIADGPDGPRTAYADQPGYAPLSEGLGRLRSCDKVAFHNGFGYDYWAINKLYPGTLRKEQILDTLLLFRMKDPESLHRLEIIGERVGYPKLDFHDYSQFSEEMVTYCLRDVEIMQKAWGLVKDYYEKNQAAIQLEHDVLYCIEMQRIQGVKFNEEKAKELVKEIQEAYFKQEKSLQTIFPPIITPRVSEKTGKILKPDVEVFNPGSRDQIAKRLITKYGWVPDQKTEGGKPKVDEEVLSELPYPEAKAMADYLTIGKRLSQISEGKSGWLQLVQNGRLHGSVNTVGARTHRMSHFKPNVSQTPKVRKDSDGNLLRGREGYWGYECRELFEPDDGHILVGCDADSLELRMLAHYLARYDGGAFAKSVNEGSSKDGTDPHTRTKVVCGLYLRKNAKTIRYAFQYGAFDNKLGNIAKSDALEAGHSLEGSASKIGKRMRSLLISGTEGLEGVLKAVSHYHKKYSAIPSLDGRWIKSPSDHSALNTLLQSGGSIVMKRALALFYGEFQELIETKQINFRINSHDEVQMSCVPDYSQMAGEGFADAIRKAGEYYEMRCPLKGNADYGSNWAETH